MQTNSKALSPQEQKDEEMINAAFQHLLDTYLASNHRRKVDLITKAFHFAKEAHKGVRRRSGEPHSASHCRGTDCLRRNRARVHFNLRRTAARCGGGY